MKKITTILMLITTVFSMNAQSITNGDFSVAATSWTDISIAPNQIAWAGEAILIVGTSSATGDFAGITQNISGLTIGTTYDVNFEITQITTAMPATAIFTADIGGTSSGFTTTGTKAVSFTATATSHVLSFKNTKTAATGNHNTNIDNVSITEVLAVQENEIFTKLVLFPNPAKTAATVRFGTNLTNVTAKVHNILGQAVQNVKVAVTATNLTLNVSSLASGLYIVTITSNEGIVKRRLVIE